jgi:hypothetical protein
MNPIPAQANIRDWTAVSRADGTPIVAGTVNFYLIAITGTNAGKWFRGSDSSWQAAEAIAGAMAHRSDGHWYVSLAAAAWIDGVEYEEYGKESGNLHVPIATQCRCENPLSTVKTKTDLLSAGSVTLRSDVSTDGTRLTLTRGDAYSIAAGTAKRFTFLTGVARDLTGAVAVRFSARDKATDALLIDAVTCTVVQAGVGAQIIDLELTTAQTEDLVPGFEVGYFDLEADYGSGDYCTIVREGRLTVKRDETRH